MRRFAAKFTLQCHISSCFSFIWAWIYCSKCRQTKLLILADPTTCGKARLLRTGWFYGARLLCSGWFLGRAVRLRTILRVNLLHPKAPSPALAILFFRTGFARPSRTSNGANHIEITRVVLKKSVRWPRVPLLAEFPQFNLPLSVRQKRRARATHERLVKRHLSGTSTRSPCEAPRSSRIGSSETRSE